LPWTPVPPGMSVIGFDIDAAARGRVVAAVADQIARLYVLPEPAATMAASLTEGLRTGAFDGFSNGWSLANELTAHLRRVNADLHLSVGFSPLAGGPPMPTPGVARPRPMNPADCGFERAEILEGNVGYIKINELADPVRCSTKATDALRLIGGATAAIFDLRDGIGGNAAMSMLLYAQLFDSPARVSAVQARDSVQLRELRWPERAADVPLTDTPVYVLTSAETFSGAEAFAYDLQALKRATIVGEATKGGAHMPQLERIDERFVLSLPRARAVNPITGTNWEGVGVRPDVAVPARDALSTALRLASQATP
jgi:retinol-binding protein 3